MRVLVVGGGVAGVAAAWSAREAGNTALVIAGQAGATMFASGALLGWRHDLAAGEPTPQQDGSLQRFCAELGYWEPKANCHFATASGTVQVAMGLDPSLLNLDDIAGRRIGVVDPDRWDWDAPQLTALWAESPWALRTNTRFETVRLELPALSKLPGTLPLRDYARTFQEDAVLEGVEKRLREVERIDAWLFGPWLGICHPEQERVADRLSQRSGRPAGEAGAALSGPAGARWLLARDALLKHKHVELIAGSLASLEVSPSQVHAKLRDGQSVTADTAVLATGGVAAGGIELQAYPTGSRAFQFRPTFVAPVELELDGETLEHPGSLHGFEFRHGLDELERVGIATDGARVRNCERLFVAGDARAGAPRTVLHAIASGIAAGQQASLVGERQRQ